MTKKPPASDPEDVAHACCDFIENVVVHVSSFFMSRSVPDDSSDLEHSMFTITLRVERCTGSQMSPLE
jgi:hypothetical protein